MQGTSNSDYVPCFQKKVGLTGKALAFFSVFLVYSSDAKNEMVETVISPNPSNVRHNPVPILSPYDGIYSHGVETSGAGRYLHISGQIGYTKEGLMPKSFRSQSLQAIRNIKEVLDSAKMEFSDVVQMRFYLVNREDTEELIKVRTEMLNGLAPAVTTYIVGGLLSEEWLIEIEALAFQPTLKP